MKHLNDKRTMWHDSCDSSCDDENVIEVERNLVYGLANLADGINQKLSNKANLATAKFETPIKDNLDGATAPSTGGKIMPSPGRQISNAIKRT